MHPAGLFAYMHNFVNIVRSIHAPWQKLVAREHDFLCWPSLCPTRLLGWSKNSHQCIYLLYSSNIHLIQHRLNNYHFLLLKSVLLSCQWPVYIVNLFVLTLNCSSNGYNLCFHVRSIRSCTLYNPPYIWQTKRQCLLMCMSRCLLTDGL